MSYQSRSRSTDRRFYGIAEAIVTAVRNDGYVKLNFPWFSDTMESEWCRVLQFFAGPGHGAFFIPEVGSEVAVAFVHGDMRLPIVLGGFFNGQDLSPGTGTEMDSHVRNRRIESEQGHRISFLDAKGETQGALVLQDAGGGCVALSSTGTLVIKSRGAVVIDAPLITFKGPGWQRTMTPNKNTV